MKGLIILELSSNSDYNYNKACKKQIKHCTGNKICSVTGLMDTTCSFKSTGGGKSSKISDKNVSEEKKNMTYDKIVDLLIKGQKLKFQYPVTDICCRIESSLLTEDLGIKQILSSVYDYVIVTDNWDRNEIEQIKKSKQYDIVKKMDMSHVGLDDSIFDTDYEYHQLKTMLGPNLRDHFMFKERDLEIEQRGGFNFNKKKIKYQKKDSDPKLNTVCEMYHTECRHIKHQHLKYYHTNKNTQYRPFDLKPMFDHIKEYDYLTPVQKLSEYHSKNSYYERLHNRNKNILNNAISSKLRLNLVDQIDADDRDSIILEFLKCRPKTFVITLWRPAIGGLDKFIELLEKNGNVYCIKTITLSKQGLRNLLFWYYDDFTYAERLNFIEKKMDYIDVTEDNNPICYILFDNVNNKHLSGQGSEFKKELRNKIMEFSGLSKDKYRGNDLLHVNDYFYQTVEYSQLLLNKNSISVLNNQNCKAVATDNFVIANLKMQTLRKIVYSDMSQLEIDRMLTMGGTVFYSYGIRAFNDVDAILIDIEPSSSHDLSRIVENMFSDKKSKFYFLDAGIQGSSGWNDSWTKKDQKILDFLIIDSFKDLVLDPANFFYHQGMKMVSLDYEMIRKLMRNRTEDHVDFMMINLIEPKIIDRYVKLTDKYASAIDSATLSTLDTSSASDSTNIETSEYQDNDNKFFKINKKYADIVGPYDDRFPGSKMKILKRRYGYNQIEPVKNTYAFKDFFGIFENDHESTDHSLSGTLDNDPNIASDSV